MENAIKVKTKILKSMALAIAVFGLFAITTMPAVAQSNGMGVTPRISLGSEPGGVIRDSLRVNNLSSTQPLILQISIIDFRAADESGTPQLIRDPNAQPTPWSLKPYITLPETVTIPAGQSSNIPFTIRFPENVGAGSYYSAVEYQAVSGTDAQRVNIAASSATLLFINLQGDASELVSILDFGPSINGEIKSSFTTPPTNFAYRIKNSGNLNEAPAGSIVIKNLFGDIVAHIDSVNPKQELALIGQTRRFEVCYPRSTVETDLVKSDNCQPVKIIPGLYKAELVLLYGQNGQPTRQIGATAMFWYMPLWAIIVAILLLAGLAWIIYSIVRRLRSSRRRR